METILYLLLPPNSYACASVGTLTQNIIAHYVLKPLLDLLSDPDYVNQCIVWLVSKKKYFYLSESFICFCSKTANSVYVTYSV